MKNEWPMLSWHIKRWLWDTHRYCHKQHVRHLQLRRCKSENDKQKEEPDNLWREKRKSALRQDTHATRVHFTQANSATQMLMFLICNMDWYCHVAKKGNWRKYIFTESFSQDWNANKITSTSSPTAESTSSKGQMSVIPTQHLHTGVLHIEWWWEVWGWETAGRRLCEGSWWSHLPCYSLLCASQRHSGLQRWGSSQGHTEDTKNDSNDPSGLFMWSDMSHSQFFQ